MEYIIEIIPFIIIFLSTVNVLRMAILMVGSDIYRVLSYFRSAELKKILYFSFPTVSVIIPAFNEEKTILRCVRSVVASDYPKSKLEIIIVDDGSSDNTLRLLESYRRANADENMRIISQPNRGKARALNNGIKHYSRGSLVMCLDADSFLEKTAIKRSVFYFEDRRVVALAANVKIPRTKGLLNLIQIFEYAVSYQIKRAQTVYNIEYIIGGIGSTFRKSFLEKIGFYDENTVTEDIDLTMKILRYGNKNIRVVYGSDVIAYTESVLSISGLIRQRHRWKWGRCQTFYKNNSMFFSTDERFTKGLTWFYIPFAVFSDIAFLFEPVTVCYILYFIFAYKDFSILFSAFGVILFYVVMNILSEDTMSIKDKIHLIFLSPLMYFLFYILSYAEYVALLKSLFKLHTLKESLAFSTCNWKPVKRSSYA